MTERCRAEDVSASVLDIQYGGFKPATVSAGESYGAPQAPPVSSYDTPAAQAPDSYGSPQAGPVSEPGNPLPSNGVQVDTPVENFISQVDPEAKSVVDDNNYDPFVFQAVGQAGQVSDDAKTGNLQLGNFNNNNNIAAAGHNNNRGHNTNTFDAPEFTSTSLNEPLVFESNNNDNIFNPFGVSVATAHDPTQRPNNFPSSTERPNSIVVTPFGQQQLNNNNNNTTVNQTTNLNITHKRRKSIKTQISQMEIRKHLLKENQPPPNINNQILRTMMT